MPDSLSDVLAYIDEHSAEFFEQLKTVCAQPSVSATGEGVAEMGALVADILRQTGAEVEVLPEEGSHGPVVFAKLINDGLHGTRPTLLFYNHYDVQPVDPLDLWQTPPFEPTIRDDKFYARGVSDNKGNWLARVLAVRAFLATRGNLPVDLKFFVEGEEEMGSDHLEEFMQAQAEKFGADACVWEGGSNTADGRIMLSLGLKGLLTIELEAKGTARDAHSSLAAVLPSGAWRLIWALQALKNDSEEITIEGFYDDVSVPAPGDMELLQAIQVDDAARLVQYNIPEYVGGLNGVQVRLAEYLMPTANVTGIETGYMGEGFKTVLPATGRARLDFRLVPDQDPDHIFLLLQERMIEAGFGDDVRVTNLGGCKPARTSSKHPFAQLAQRVAEEVAGAPPVVIPLMPGSGPMFQFKDHLNGIPIVGAGGGYDGSAQHAPNENVRMADLLRHAKFIATLMQRMAEDATLQGMVGKDEEIAAFNTAQAENITGVPVSITPQVQPDEELDIAGLFNIDAAEAFLNGEEDSAAPIPVAVSAAAPQPTRSGRSKRSRKRKGG